MSQKLHTFARLQLMFHPVNEKFQYTRRKKHTSEQTTEHNINTQQHKHHYIGQLQQPVTVVSTCRTLTSKFTKNLW